MNSNSNFDTPSKLGRLTAHMRMLVTGIAVTGGCGFIMLTDSAFNPAPRAEGAVPAVKTETSVAAEEVSIKSTEIKTAAASAVRAYWRAWSIR